jgi:hypothetical protein
LYGDFALFLPGPLADELDQRIIDLLWMRGTEEVSAGWHSHQISRLCILEELDLLFGVCNRVDGIISPLYGESATELQGRMICRYKRNVQKNLDSREAT